MGIFVWLKKFESPNLRDDEVSKKKQTKTKKLKRRGNYHIPIPAPGSENNTSGE